MNPLSGNCSKFHRFIAGCLGITLTTMPVAGLAIICLAALAMLLSFSCGSPIPTIPASTSTPHRRPTLTPTNTPVPTPLTPTPRSQVTLTEPEDDSRVECESELVLCWNHFYELLANEYYRLKVWAEGQTLSVFYPREKRFTLPDLSPGEYKWTVAIVRSMTPDTYEQVSEESEPRHFHVLLPAPIVLGILPTSIVKGAGGQVVVSGGNFTSPITLTVGVPLQIIDTAFSAITATIPTTLAAGEYPVIVQDSNGRVVSSTVSFTVKKPTAPPTPPPPNITLISPVDNVHAGNRAEMTWEWPGSWEALGPDAVFAIRWGLVSEGEPHSQVWCTVIQRPGESWCPDKKWLKDFTDCDDLGERAMVWNVALALADWEARSYRQVLVQSELAYFRVQTNINNCPP